MRTALRIVAVALGLLLAARPLDLVEGTAREWLLGTAAVAVLLVLAAAARPAGMLPQLAGAALVGAYALGLAAGDGRLDPLAPLVGLGLLLFLDLLEAVVELGPPAVRLRYERGLALRRIRWTGLVAAGGLLAALAVLAVAPSSGAGDDAGVRALAMLGAAAALAVPVLLARRTLRRPRGELED